MHPMLVPQTKPGGVPHRLLEVILEIFEVLGGLGRFGRMLRAVLHGYGRFGRALERLLDGLWRGVGRSWRSFWVLCWGLRWQRNPKAIGKSVAPRDRRFQGGFLMDFVSKISSPGDHKICI